MKESARIALSYVRGTRPSSGSRGCVRGRVVHIHVPAGATPKDGPSAGVTMLTALVSLLTGRPVKHTVGMTGEITLQGRVLPIGGLKQKALAAHAAGLTDVVLPERNRGDLDKIPEEVREQMQFHPVMTVPRCSSSRSSRRAMSRCRSAMAGARGGPRRVADLLERRWLLSIVCAACNGEVRFNAFIETVPGISPRMLSERLRDLERAGLIERRSCCRRRQPANRRIPPDERAVARSSR
jgi:hypothetical protein